MFTGEVNQLSGRRSLVQCKAREASTVIEISRANLRHVIENDAELSELFLRVFLLRRVYLIRNSVGDAVLIGSSHSADTLRLQGFLSRNGHPHTYLDVERDADTQAALDQFGIPVTDIPVLICRGTLVLRNPTNAAAAECFGLNEGIDEESVYDLVVIGAGPSGLAAAVYGASEGSRRRPGNRDQRPRRPGCGLSSRDRKLPRFPRWNLRPGSRRPGVCAGPKIWRENRSRPVGAGAGMQQESLFSGSRRR